MIEVETVRSDRWQFLTRFLIYRDKLEIISFQQKSDTRVLKPILLNLEWCSSRGFKMEVKNKIVVIASRFLKSDTLVIWPVHIEIDRKSVV